ncbi:hypothetical protein DKZ29_06200 [Limosilactobacillus reuteri]|uniref:hypothetical protein n=1 Tax=Limosilactobacillus reuteri TaxID=1598 RepID=UPI000D6F62F1|nr:hypothetical protein [Limosilactobacillus reuteri]PWT35127.1 hypothetical protein DKZ24_05335 [Limosilactobacillus reuteri]PWT58279.1 hypothetical protein DKZ29_06200 [Limosilactobacillus reuteri]PWT59929.1 hypothetical protein DKZ30_04590 [Limosilactobacillus reuteri]PWT66573.1 hypothetical protein DKZ28_05045 [Limosilactobacillus reuteri]
MAGITGFIVTLFLIIIAAFINYLFRNAKRLGTYKSFIWFYIFIFASWIVIFRGNLYDSTLIFGGLYLLYVVLIFFHDLFSQNKVRFSLFSKILGYSLLICAFVSYESQFVAINLFVLGLIWLALFGYNGLEKSRDFLNKSSAFDNKEKSSIEREKVTIKYWSNLSREKKLEYTITGVIICAFLAIYITLWIVNKYVLTYVLWVSFAFAVIGLLIILLMWEKRKETHKNWQFLLGIVTILFIGTCTVQLKVNDMNSKFLKAERAYLRDSFEFIVNSDEDDIDYSTEEAMTKEIKTMEKNNTGKYYTRLVKQIKDYNKITTEFEE